MEEYDPEETMIEDEAVHLEDVAEFSEEDAGTQRLINHVMGCYQRSKDARRQDEDRWLRNYSNYRGIYGHDVQFTEAEKSRVFIKVTKTKVLAAYGQMVDVLFASHKFPLSVDPSKLPEGVVESAHFDPKKLDIDDEGAVGLNDQVPVTGQLRGSEPKPKSLSEMLGSFRKKLSGVDDLQAGTGSTPSAVNFFPAEVAAKKMEKKIHDQLEASNASKKLRSTAFEMALFGTGILKGPFAVDKEYPNWDENGEYNPTIKTVPALDHVSVWNFYPDPDAANMDEASFVVERHKMSRSQLRQLKKRPFFRGDVIDDVVERGEYYDKEHWEDDLADYRTESGIERFEVFEYWGTMDTADLEEAEVDIPEELQGFDELNANIWICGGRVLRCVLNPFKPAKIPYYAAPYELNPYSFFGIGIAENMDDTQTLMNGFMRMAVDNAVLSGNLLIEVDETNLVPGQDLSVYPGKVFRRQGGAPGQAIFGTKYPNVAAENLQLFDKARVLADESTGMPSFAHGQTGVSGVGRTASGISMLMGAAQGGIKTVIKNIDDYLLRPLGEAFFSFNMQFDYDEEIKGDLEVKARGTESLMANEVRSQRLMQFMQISSNPALAPFAKFPYIIREIAKSMDLDPDKVTNSMEEAARQAQIQKQTMPEQAQSPQMDASGRGDGNIGTGNVPVPGMQGFSGNAPAPAQPAQPQAGGQPPQAPLQ